MSCSATAISSSSNLCSGFSTALLARFPTFVTTLAARAIPSPFHFGDGARKLPCLCFKPRHPFPVLPSFRLGKLADYPTVAAFHAVEPDALGQFHGHLFVNIGRRRRPSPSYQVLFLCGITRQFVLEPGRTAALVSLQHPYVYTAVLFVQLLWGDLCSNSFERSRTNRKQLQQIPAYGHLFPHVRGAQTVITRLLRPRSARTPPLIRVRGEEVAGDPHPARR